MLPSRLLADSHFALLAACAHRSEGAPTQLAITIGIGQRTARLPA